MICSRQELKIITPNQEKVEYVQGVYSRLDNSAIEMMAKTFVYAAHMARQAGTLKTENASVLQCMHALLSSKILVDPFYNENMGISAYGVSALLNYEMMYFFIQKYIGLNPQSQLAKYQNKLLDEVFLIYKDTFDLTATKTLIDKLLPYSLHGKHDYILFTALIHPEHAEKLITYELSPNSEIFLIIKEKFTVHNKYWGKEGLTSNPFLLESASISTPISQAPVLFSPELKLNLPLFSADIQMSFSPLPSAATQVTKSALPDSQPPLIPTPAELNIAPQRPTRKRLMLRPAAPVSQSHSSFFSSNPLKELKKLSEKPPVVPTNNTQERLRPSIKRTRVFTPTPPSPNQSSSSLLSKPLTRSEQNKKLQEEGRTPHRLRKIS
jgi:hypothetical protein